MALSSNSAVPAVQVCVEAPQETSVREVTLDGQEIYAPQLTMSDNLTRLAQRIDFGDQGERKTRLGTRLPQSRAGGQGLFLRSLDHLGRSSEAKDRKNKKKV